jgi:hypothetical protein
MRKRPPFWLFVVLLAAVGAFGAGAETPKAAVPYTDDEFPAWARDLRRAEVVAFGALPITIFYAQFSIDCYRFAVADWDRRYAPWPIKSAGAVPMTDAQSRTALAAGVVGAVLTAVVDYFLARYKRSLAERRVGTETGAPFRTETILPPATAAPSP